MEFEYKDERRRSKAVVAVGLVLALVAGGTAFYLVNRAQQQAGQSSVPRVPAVVAVAAIPARTEIKESDVAVREVPLDDSNANGVATEVSQVVGRIPAVSILQGQLVTTNMLASSTEGAQFSILDPGESFAPDSEPWRAVSITVTDDLAVGGVLEPGQTVDVFVTAVVQVPASVAEAGRYYSDRSTKITYQDMVILARKNTFYILKTTLPIAEEIAHLQASGNATFSFALRPTVDQRSVDATSLGETTTRIIEKYGLPIPQTMSTRGGAAVPTASPVIVPAATSSPSAAPPASSSPSAPAPSAS
ncbi:MAG: Flp pilus assembly protein CpaB [Chloroflexota bacterium]|jgi:Flp pilus assembly protein CpaB